MIGNRIKLARVARGKSQQWLAQEIGVRQTSVSAWERGFSDPTVDNMSRVSQVLNVNFEWLAKGTGTMEGANDESATLAEPRTPYEIYSTEQRELMTLFEKLSKNKRKVLMDFVRGWLE
ncbi:helix-turn-helix transcriptional regulator [Neisseria dumasiana]|uniref:HTH cro/C1-type domain-containing protein n=1 Tax=Neisseria dumasiana TaxID=1931275 RepID=A0A1X3DHQ4_9NEIS|nr:helix-turn-helix domain-containing protein [Neisseria dumasiana]OSI20417.1 hypothetical protein BV912_07555 [Neisseria dumasiana]